MANAGNRVEGELNLGGYPRDILQNADEKFICNYCGNVLKDPVQSFCGHRFCRSCILGVAT